MNDQPTPATEGPFYIVDLRVEWSRRPYITVWRPDNKGYAYPLPWAGLYDQATVNAGGDYYSTKDGTREWRRFPVPRHVVEALAIPQPEPGVIDGNVGPVLRNNVHIRDALRRARYVPQKAINDAA
jgi:hypothetical protein